MSEISEVMIDLETMSLNPDASILTIGAVKFNRKKRVRTIKNMDTFYRRITISSCEKAGLHVDPENINWWKNQSAEAIYEAIEHPDRVPIKQALVEFSEWFGDSELIWANGDDFDCVILASAYKACKIPVPWKFWNTRDVRTILDIAGVNLKDMPPPKVLHHALYDAYRQVLAVREAFKRIRVDTD